MSKAILQHVFSREDIDQTKVFLHGRSLGGAVVNYVMTNTNYPVAGVILENTFTSIADLVDIMFPKLSFMKGYIQRNFWPSIDRVGKITQPILFVMGKNSKKYIFSFIFSAMKDEIVPPDQMVRLFSKAEKTVYKEKVNQFCLKGGKKN